MSPSVEEIRRAAESRMRELTPVLKEIAQLQKILEVTKDGAPDSNGTGGDTAVDLPEFAVEDGVLKPRRGPDGRAVRGSNKTVILEVVRANPGIAAPEIAALTDLKREVISATIYRLKKQGAVVDYGKGVRIAVAPAKKRKFLLEVVSDRPGITVAELADIASLDPSIAAVTADYLVEHDELTRDGEGLTATS
jgi:hypothetical protein